MQLTTHLLVIILLLLEMMAFWDAVTSAGPFASNLQLAADTQPRHDGCFASASRQCEVA